LRLGAALALNRADIRQKIFPATSAGPFFGSDLKGASGWGATVKLGILAPASNGLTLGASFTPKVKLPLRGGRLISNQTAAGRGLVTYRDIEIDGLVLPTEVSLGAAWRPVPDWMLSAELTWLDWSRAATRSTLAARNPDNAAAPDLNVTSALNWRDQVVLAIGAAWNMDSRTTLYAGLNLARNPIPPTHLNPILAPVGERHLTFGIKRALDTEWSFAFATEYQFRNTVTYTNPDLPFGVDARERNESVAFHAVFGRRW
jgi:long-chain fatty acid transport protein